MYYNGLHPKKKEMHPENKNRILGAKLSVAKCYQSAPKKKENAPRCKMHLGADGINPVCAPEAAQGRVFSRRPARATHRCTVLARPPRERQHPSKVMRSSPIGDSLVGPGGRIGGRPLDGSYAFAEVHEPTAKFSQ